MRFLVLLASHRGNKQRKVCFLIFFFSVKFSYFLTGKEDATQGKGIHLLLMKSLKYFDISPLAYQCMLVRSSALL